ncbi:hypothetical protein RI129_013192 [Pyrocoelia pectoralis]|uniref:Uncharacterized protein n=1 Tax=Pyrocoelia pectoralis TaxID=417401 RepID=A0AAN7ZCV3_9COLE
MMLVNLIFSVLVFLVFENIYVTCSRYYCACEKTTPKPTDNKNVFGYYWRDYSGKTPSDAVIGGYDATETPTYVGQVYKKNYELLPATFTLDCTNGITTAHGRVVYSDKNMKILCSAEPEKMKWYPTKVGELDKLSDCTLVVGGSEDEHVLHIGRVKYHGQTIIGKVFSRGHGARGLWIPYRDGSVHFTSYDILVYNCTQCH